MKKYNEFLIFRRLLLPQVATHKCVSLLHALNEGGGSYIMTKNLFCKRHIIIQQAILKKIIKIVKY